MLTKDPAVIPSPVPSETKVENPDQQEGGGEGRRVGINLG